MKNKIFSFTLAMIVGLGVFTVSSVAEAYQCRWVNGHRVCWQGKYQRYHHGYYRNCKWVNSYRTGGVWHERHRVCW